MRLLLVFKVSWIRHKDTHLLTAGRYTYTSDERFRAIHKVGVMYIIVLVSMQQNCKTYFIPGWILFYSSLSVSIFIFPQVLSEDYLLQIDPVQVRLLSADMNKSSLI